MNKCSFDRTRKSHNEFGNSSRNAVDPSSSSSSSNTQDPSNSNQIFSVTQSKKDPFNFNIQPIKNSSNLSDPSSENQLMSNQESNGKSLSLTGTLNLAPLIQKLSVSLIKEFNWLYFKGKLRSFIKLNMKHDPKDKSTLFF